MNNFSLGFWGYAAHSVPGVLALITPYADDLTDAYPITTNPKNDSPSIIEPVEVKE